MTEAQPAYDPAAAWAQIEAQYAARTRLAEEALPANKTALFDALAAAGITSVVVTFDGVGDSGQIEEIDARVGDVTTELPPVAIKIATPAWDGSALDRRSLPLRDAVEDLAYAFLEESPRRLGEQRRRVRRIHLRRRGADDRARLQRADRDLRISRPQLVTGGHDGTLLSPRAVVRPQMGRDRR